MLEAAQNKTLRPAEKIAHAAPQPKHSTGPAPQALPPRYKAPTKMLESGIYKATTQPYTHGLLRWIQRCRKNIICILNKAHRS